MYPIPKWQIFFLVRRQKIPDQHSIQESRKRASKNVNKDKKVFMTMLGLFMTVTSAAVPVYNSHW